MRQILNAAGHREVKLEMQRTRAQLGILVSDDAQLWGQLEKLHAGEKARAFAETLGELAVVSGYQPEEVVLAIIPQHFGRDPKNPINGLLGLMDHGSDDPRYPRLCAAIAEYLDARYNRDGASRLN